MPDVLEVWSGREAATAFVRRERLDRETVARVEDGVKALVGRGVRRVILGFGRVRDLDGDAADLLRDFGRGLVTTDADIVLFGVPGSLAPEVMALPVCADEESAHRWTRGN